MDKKSDESSGSSTNLRSAAGYLFCLRGTVPCRPSLALWSLDADFVLTRGEELSPTRRAARRGLPIPFLIRRSRFMLAVAKRRGLSMYARWIQTFGDRSRFLFFFLRLVSMHVQYTSRLNMFYYET